jgi:hypothetical protein
LAKAEQEQDTAAKWTVLLIDNTRVNEQPVRLKIANNMKGAVFIVGILVGHATNVVDEQPRSIVKLSAALVAKVFAHWRGVHGPLISR